MTPLHALLVLRDRSEAEGLAALIAAAVYAAPAYTDTVQGALDPKLPIIYVCVMEFKVFRLTLVRT